jgi:Zn finger protein HypA/HybF involved in hydrogenase expression
VADTKDWEKNFRYYFGLDHWPVNSTASKAYSDSSVPQTVCNYLFATINSKAAAVLSATPRLRAEPMDGFSTLEQRDKAANATRHELERCHWKDIRKDAFLTAAVNELGIAMLRMERDELSGEYKTRWDPVDQRYLYMDPEATRFYNCEHVHYEPELSMAKVREICEMLGVPEKADKITPRRSQTAGSVVRDNGVSRTAEEIINAPGRELVVGQDGAIAQRVAQVCFSWIKQPGLYEDTRKVVTREAMVALECQDCGLRMEIGVSDVCPSCQSPNLMQVEVPEESEQKTVIRREYPYGRLIVTCQDTLIYDGPNNIELDCVFPFAVYTHYRDPRKIRGSSDMKLLKSNQQQADKNMSRLFQAMALTGQGYLEYPAGELGWQHSSNELGTKIPVKPENAGKARWVTVGGYNVQLHSVGENAIFSAFQRISLQADQAVSQMPSAPDSATEVRSRDSIRSTGLGEHLNEMNEFSSQMATMQWQAMVQYYVGPRPFMFSVNGSQFESVVEDVSLLPRNIRIRVEADIDATEKDKNIGQNLMAFIQSGGMESPYAKFFLMTLGASEAQVNELMAIQQQYMIQQQQMALAAMSGQGANANGNSPAPPDGAGPQPQAPNSEGVN